MLLILVGYALLTVGGASATGGTATATTQTIATPFDPTYTCKPLPDIPEASAYFGITIWGSKIYRAGGRKENIEAISIVDKFLEHPRMFIFGNNGDPKIYISSADWMTRNIDKRVEVTCPIYDEDIKKKIIMDGR